MKWLFLTALVFWSINCFAQTAIERGDFGLGFQATMPMIGMSVKYDLSNKFGVQGAFGVFGDVLTGSVRVNMMRKRPYHTAMLYLSYGTFQYDYEPDPLYPTSYKTSYNGIGAGFGLEWFLKKLPELGLGVDVGYLHGISDFSASSKTSKTTMVAGAGIHYYFN